MSHKYSEVSQRIQTTEAAQITHPHKSTTTVKEPKIIKYTGGVTSASGERGGLIFDRPNEVRRFQKIFQVPNSLPVFLKKGRSDELIYKGLMTSSLVGLVIASFGFYKMAMPSKPN
ncbi:cytochrome c oxidase subunit 7A2, mitochondrial-like [Rhopilema esculentum]|uniref:cytochrome c oxidase subunit 7A2, mitochondrial-like n=1 Tax=Rhopilema esculentum TaxID=499914 RepID=UPI0031D020DB